MSPDATQHNPDPLYLRELLHKAGLSQEQAADRIGIGRRTMRQYLAARESAKRYSAAPYPVQFALEALASA